MPDTDDRPYRTHYRSAPGEVTLRDADALDDADDGMMAIRMPIASTGEVRNEGDDPLSTAEIRGMAEQVNDLTTGVFPEHGTSDTVDGGQYSQFEKLGYWDDGEVEGEAAADGADLLMATARMPDPDTLPDTTGDYREALAILKSQAERGIPIDASIGWREDDGFAGGNDLMEASIVGIGADPRTNTAGADPAAVVAREAVAAGADPTDLVERVQSAVRNLDDPAFGEGDKVRWSFDDTPVHGRVAGVHEQYTPPELDDPITGEDGEAVYSIHEYDEDTEELSDTANVAKPESSLSESSMEMPTLDSTNSMTDDDPPESDPGDDTDGEQTADDGETTTRAPEDVSADDLFTFTARHLDGMDEGDLAEAVDAADAEYVGEANPEALADFMSVVTGAEYDAAIDALEGLMTEDQMGDKDGEEDEEEDEEDDDRESDPEYARKEEVESLREELEAVRSGEVDLEPNADTDTDDDRDASEAEGSDDTETDETRDGGPVNVADHF